MAALNIRDLDDQQLREKALQRVKLPIGKWVVCIDELVQRGLPIPVEEDVFLTQLGKLSRAERHFLNDNLSQFSWYTLSCLSGKPFDERIWFIAREEREQLQVSLLEILQFGKETGTPFFFWKEGMSAWESSKCIEHWKQEKPPVFDPISEAIPERAYQEKTMPVNTGGSGVSTMLGVFTFLGMPVWIILLIAAIASGFNSFMGPMLPTVFCIFMFVMAIPLGIGVLQKKRWAWGMLVITTLFSVFWFAGHYFFDEASRIWMILAVFEVIILTLALSAKENFA